jgi:hypothetical protein
MRLFKRWPHALLVAALATAGLVGVGQPASADEPPVCPNRWADQQAMADEPAPLCRDTWLVDPGRGNILTRSDLVRAHDLYGSHGFSLPWLWYAEESTVSFPGQYPQRWTSCPSGVPHVDGVCAATGQLPDNQLTANFTHTPVVMTVWQHNGNFISAVCGNYGVPAGPVDTPSPKVKVHKFDDLNGNQIQDAGEPSLAGWTFQLVRQTSLFNDQDSGLAGTATTDANGDLTFPLSDLGAGPGTYVVQEVPQDDWAPTAAPSQPFVVRDGAGDTTVESLVFGNTFEAITAAGTPIAPTEGLPFTGTVANFSDPDPAGTAEEYEATADWGDGTVSPATIVKGADGTFTVAGTHTYREEGVDTVTVAIRDRDNAANTATATTQATVGDAALTAAGNPNLLSANPVTNLPVATFTDANPGGTVADFTASIDWGDGTAASNGPVSGPDGGPFTVTGSHTYATLGPKAITVHILDVGGSTAVALSQLILFAYPAGGNFVIGNGSTATGASVNFWGSQWEKSNPLANGTPPAAFKGFEDNPLVPACGGTWISRPGNSSNPPDTVPTYMAVIVSTHVEQNGSAISGDVQHVVIVATGPGYAGNPGHAANGTVIATLC